MWASSGVVEKSVGIFKRAFGGWVEYGHCLSVLGTLQLARGIDERSSLNILAGIRILHATMYGKKEEQILVVVQSRDV